MSKIDNRESFVKSISEKFGVKDSYSRTEINNACLELGVTRQAWMLENKVSRGMYTFEPIAIVDLNIKKLSVESIIKSKIDTPEIDPNYIPFGFNKDLTLIVKSNIFYPVLITGEHGSGKTKMVEQVCAQLNRKLIRTNISIDTDETDLIGSQSLEDGNIVFKDGPVLTAMREGGILLLDEIDRGTSKLLSILSILEGSPFYNKKTGETIYPKEGFNIIATGNTKGFGEKPKYLAQILDTAFLERFGITVEQEYPDAKTETKILLKVLNDVEFVDTLVKWTAVIRETYSQGGIEDFISTRRLIHIAQCYNIFKNKKKAVELCVSRFEDDTKIAFIDLFNKISNGEDEEIVEGISDGITPTNEATW